MTPGPATGTTTAEWFAEAKRAGCTGTSFDTETDTIFHDDAPHCPVHHI